MSCTPSQCIAADRISTSNFERQAENANQKRFEYASFFSGSSVCGHISTNDWSQVHTELFGGLVSTNTSDQGNTHNPCRVHLSLDKTSNLVSSQIGKPSEAASTRDIHRAKEALSSMGSSQSTASTPSSLAKETTSKQPSETDSAPSPVPSINTENSNSTDEGESKCPMHQSDGTYSYDWLAVFRPNFPHGPSGAKPLSDAEAKANITRRATALDGSMASPGGGCPVKTHQQYNVYSQPIDPTNQMPSNPNQLPAPGQSAQLSTERVQSNIPKV